MTDYLPLIETALDGYSAAFDLPELFYRSMRYSLLDGGKRIRACLCLACKGQEDEDDCYEFFHGDDMCHCAKI